jgi:hypothetical protein
MKTVLTNRLGAVYTFKVAWYGKMISQHVFPNPMNDVKRYSTDDKGLNCRG